MYVRALALVFTLVLLVSPVLSLVDVYLENIIVDVYRDGSVSVFAKATLHLPRSPHPLSYLELKASADLGSRVAVDAELSVHMLEVFDGSLAINIKSSTRPTGPQVLASSTSLVFLFEDYRGNSVAVNLTRLNTTLDVKTLVYRFTGELEIRATGEPVTIVRSVPMLITLIQSQIQRDPALAGVLDVKELSYEVRDYTVVRFNLEYNYDLYLRKTMPEHAARLRELLENATTSAMKCPTSAEALFNITRSSITARYSERVECDVNSYLNTTILLFEHALSTLHEQTLPTYAPGIPVVDNLELARRSLSEATSFINFIKALTEEFEIKPSTTTLVLRLEGSKVTVEINTPRLLKREAQTPSDTLRALYGFATKAVQEPKLESVGLGLEELEETEVAIRAEQGVKVKVGGEEVREVKFADLEKAEVEVEKPREEPVLFYTAVAVTAVAVGVSAYLLLKRK